MLQFLIFKKQNGSTVAARVPCLRVQLQLLVLRDTLVQNVLVLKLSRINILKKLLCWVIMKTNIY